MHGEKKEEQLIESICRDGLCISCGTCVGICPFDAIEPYKADDGMYNMSIDRSKCTGCGLCIGVCPQKTKDFANMNKFAFGKIPKDSLLGNTVRCYLGHTLDEKVRWDSSVGGLITSLLIFAFQEGIIDGAVVTRMSQCDPTNSETIIARSISEIVSASGPKFCPVMVNIRIKDILNEEGKFAFVGLPCHIQGLRRAEMLNKQLRQKVVLHLGNFCCHSVNLFGIDFLIQKLNICKSDIAQMDFRGRKRLGRMGGFLVKLKNGKELFIESSHYWAAFGAFFFSPLGCLLCSDHTSEFADISFGNAWVLRHQLRGQHTSESIVISRTEMGDRLLQSALFQKKIRLAKIERRIAVQSQIGDLFFKKKNLAARSSLLKHLGKNVPPTLNLSKSNFASYLSSMLVYLSVYTSSKQYGRRILRNCPFFLLRMYQLVLYALSRFLN